MLDPSDITARRAIDAPADAPLLAIIGAAASGKTETLARRYALLLARDATLTFGSTIVTAADAGGAAALAARIDRLVPAERLGERARDGHYVGVTLDRLAFDLLAENATLSGLAFDLETIDPYDAEEIFERAIAPLFSPEWADFLGPEIDPEIPGLRAPDRFAVATLRLIRKLRAAQIPPDAFLGAALRGATAFYANPPNLSAPALLFATKDEHRASLAVDAAERERQRRREIDLAKIIAKLYRAYLDELVAHGCLTASDAIAEATRLLEEHPALARSCRQRWRIAIVDDVHDLGAGELQFLQALFGKRLGGVTVAGDPDAATHTFAGARPERIFNAAATTVKLQANYRVPPQIAAVVRTLLDTPSQAPVIPAGDSVRLHRAATVEDEAAFVAATIVARIAGGTDAGRIGVLHRSLRTLALYEDALVDRNVPIALNGDGALFTRHDALDALAVLWTTVDPFAHAWLLRVLQLPALGLSDASLALLCGEPASPQGLLFDLPPQADTDGSRRWDRRRDLRLGTNVVRGDRDSELDADTRERLAAFRTQRAGWQELTLRATVSDTVEAIFADAGLGVARPDETAARTRRRRTILTTLHEVIGRYATRHPSESLAEALLYCERIARADDGPIFTDGSADAVVVAAIDCMKARRFDHVFVVDARAGSFPPYYVPDAFLFSPTYGMVPKDNVGEAATPRTVKFTWYSHQVKLRESYAREDRRALAVALARADVSVTVSAAGRPTRGVAAPEFLAELEGLGPAWQSAAALPASLAVAQTAAPIAAEPDPPPSTLDSDLPGVPGLIAAERLAEMLRCVRCAPRMVVSSALGGSFTLLSGRLPGGDARVVARDVQFGFPLGSTVVFGTVPALIGCADRTYIALARHDSAYAAFALRGLAGRAVPDGFYTETADGVFDGPHPLEPDELMQRAAAVLAGNVQPLCAEHRLAE